MHVTYRYSCEVIMSSPSLFILFDCCVRSLLFTSSGSQSAAITLKRNSAFVLTLFTFCPPGPDDLAKLISSLSYGIEIELLLPLLVSAVRNLRESLTKGKYDECVNIILLKHLEYGIACDNKKIYAIFMNIN